MTKGETMTIAEELALARRVAAEMDETYQIPLLITPQAAMCLIGELQLALRHPGNTGAATAVARSMIAGLIEKLREGGFHAHAELAECGNDERNDE